MLTKEQKQEIIKEFGENEQDTGSVAVQVALLSKNIEVLSAHFQNHKGDHASKRGMFKMIGSRKSLLKYLKRTDVEEYRVLIGKLGLRK